VPARVVITESGELPEKCQLRETAREAPFIVYAAERNLTKLSGWVGSGAQVMGLKGENTNNFLEQVLNDFGQRRFTNVLVEGGAGLHGSFTDARLADEFHVFIAPKIVGGRHAPGPVGGLGAEAIGAAIPLFHSTWQQAGSDLYVHGFASDLSVARDKN
jgi:diaminohydroxyphosphoribosylaminopyrimidine deaminase/5-amino-6-(5-phosphoribosylamino)uracil reductase